MKRFSNEDRTLDPGGSGCIVFVLLLALSGCSTVAPFITVSEFFGDDRPYEETRHTLDEALTFRDDRPLHEKADAYMDLVFERFGLDDRWFTTNLILADDSDPHGYSSAYHYNSIGDSANTGARIMSALIYDFEVRERDGLPVSGELLLRIDKAFSFIEALVTIADPDDPGMIVRGIVPKNVVESGKFDLKDRDIRDGAPSYPGLMYQGDPSTGQYPPVVRALESVYLYGPALYKARAWELLELIALRLIRDDWKVIDTDGEPTSINDFDPSVQVIGVGEPGQGTIGIFLGDELDFSTQSREDRVIMLMSILRAAAVVSGNNEIREAYLGLCRDGYALLASNAAVNLYGVMDWGKELNRFELLLSLLNPDTADAIDDAQYRPLYRSLMVKVYEWTEGARGHTPALAIWNHLMTGNKAQIEEAAQQLRDFPHPKRRREIVVSNKPGMKFSFLPEIDGNPQALAAADSVVPMYWFRQTTFNWLRDRRQLDSSGDGTREFSYADWLIGYHLMRLFGQIEATE